MNNQLVADVLTHGSFKSKSFAVAFAPVATHAVALVGAKSNPMLQLAVSMSGPAESGNAERLEQFRESFGEDGPVEDISSIACNSDGIAGLPKSIVTAGRVSSKATWLDIRLTFASAVRDRIVLALKKPDRAEKEFVVRYIQSIWPLVRECCVKEICSRRESVAERAMGWAASHLLDASIIVLDCRGNGLHFNEAAKQMFDEGSLLMRSPKGTIAASAGDTRELMAAVSACANDSSPSQDRTVLIERKGDGLRVPVSLSRYFEDGCPTPLVVAFVPRPPDRERVEALARQHGLTMTEAKVAMLMRLGLSNPVAARRAGFKEQTFNTYSKRVLKKLNVSGRAEAAQLLTWQSAGRTVS